MDEPHVNWKFYKHIVSQKEDDLRSLVNIGRCNLHVINGGLKIGAESTNLKLKKILKACFTTPAGRDDYISLTGSTAFPLFFYKVCLFDFMDDICHMHDIV